MEHTLPAPWLLGSLVTGCCERDCPRQVLAGLQGARKAPWAAATGGCAGALRTGAQAGPGARGSGGSGRRGALCVRRCLPTAGSLLCPGHWAISRGLVTSCPSAAVSAVAAGARWLVAWGPEGSGVGRGPSAAPGCGLRQGVAPARSSWSHAAVTHTCGSGPPPVSWSAGSCQMSHLAHSPDPWPLATVASRAWRQLLMHCPPWEAHAGAILLSCCFKCLFLLVVVGRGGSCCPCLHAVLRLEPGASRAGQGSALH